MTISDQTIPRPSLPGTSFARFGMADMTTGLRRWPLWGSLAWMDVRQRYRRSILGPFWITLSLGIMVLGLGLVYGALFNQDLHAYLPYLATGYIVWGLISTLLTESPYVFIVAHDTIKQIPFPLSTFVYRMVVRNLIVLAHNLLVYLVVILVFGINPGLACLLALPGLLLIGLNGLGFGFFLGLISARFRDIPQLVINASQLIFFVTPILWHRETIQSRAWVASLNPFTYLVDIVREPMLGHMPSAFTWEISGVVTFLNLTVSMIVFARYRWRIPYWL